MARGPVVTRLRSVLVGPVAVAVLLGGCSDGEVAGYDDEFREDFVSRCVDAHGRPGAEQVCGCWYQGVSATVDFEELPDVDDLVGNDFDGAPSRLPGGERDVPLATLAACVRSLGAEPTVGEPVPPPTAPRPPAPPTTGTPETTVPG